MATSGIATFTLSRDDVIKASLRLLRELGAGAVPTIEDYVNCNQALNIVLKSWQKKSIPLWKLEEIVFPLIPEQTVYPLGISGGQLVDAGITLQNGGHGGTDGSFTTPVLDYNNPAVTGTLNYIVVGGTVTEVSISSYGEGYSDPHIAPTESAGLTGVLVDIHPLGLYPSRPVRFRDAWIRDVNTESDTPLIQVARQDYNQFGNKSQPGIPNQYWYDPKLDTGFLTVYTVPSDSHRDFHGIVQVPIQDMVASIDTFDLPQEWFQAIKWGLADELSLEYGCPPDVRGEVAAKAARFLEDCFDFSVDEAPVYFSVDRSGR